MEKNLHRMYKQALELSDFFHSYSIFAQQISSEMEIIKSAKQVLQLYHQKHIQDQAEAFSQLHTRSLAHFQSAQKEFDSFESAVQTLNTTRIHEQLTNGTRSFLADLIDVGQLTRWKESYMDEISRLKDKFGEISRTIETMPSYFKLQDEDLALVDIVEVPDMISQGFQSIIDLYADYRKLCELFLVSRDASAGQRLHEENWDLKANKASQNLALLIKTRPQYQNLVTGLQELRQVGNLQLFKLLRKITEFAARIRDSVKSQLSMISSLLKRSEKRLAFIKVPRLLPEAHNSAILEISRRNYFVKIAKKIQGQLVTLIETETAERMAFLDKYRHVLPNNFVPQLSAGPFLKIVVGQNEPDLTLPEVFMDLPGEFQFKGLYERGFGGEDEKVKKLAEDNERLRKEILDLNEVIRVLRNDVKVKNNEIAEKDLQIEQQSQGLMKEVNKYKVLSQTSESEKAELRKAYQELESKLKQFKANACAEHSEYIRALEEKLKFSLASETAAKAESDKLREDLGRIANEVKLKDKRLIEAADTLKTISVEFKNKDDLIRELRDKLSQSQIKPEAQPSPAIQNLAQELRISIEELPVYIRRLKESDSAKIAFTSFNEGSLALFFPTAEGHFLAFNYNCPDHYLNIDLLSPQAIEIMHNEPYIVGLITEKKKQVAERNNPINLPQGSEYFLLTIKTDF